MSLIVTFRDTLQRIIPPWLQLGRNQKILYSIGVQLDAMGDALNAGVKLRFPNVYTNESLPLIGSERRIRRGLNETDDQYSARLRQWFADHRRRGGPFALLEQLFARYKPNNFPIELDYVSGMRFSMTADGNGDPNIGYNIVPGPNQAQWSRWVLIYFTDDFTVADAEDLATIPREWIAAHCLGLLYVLPTGGELWDFPPDYVWNDPVALWDTPDASIVVPIVSG